MDFKPRDFESKSPHSRKRKGCEAYAELCALFTTGSLTAREQAELNEHLLDCKSCAKLLLEYRAVAKAGIALLAPIDQPGAAGAQRLWSLENAKKQLLNRVEAEKAMNRPEFVPEPLPITRKWMRMLVPRSQILLGAAAVVLLVVLTGFAYRLGQLRGVRMAHETAQSTSPAEPQRAARAANADPAQSLLQERLAAQSREVQRLELELKRQMTAISEFQASFDASFHASFHAAQEKLQHDTQEQSATIMALGSDKAALTRERDALNHQLQETQNALASAQQRLDVLQQEQSRQLLRAASLQKRVDELSADLREGQETLQHQEKFVASDRGVRELMGARDLYIADVFDVDRDGKMRKPFGRVFYTGGKSLIFYAFDLDRQPGTREAGTFQAWGRRGPGDKHPFNMGVLSLDNAANRRWALHFDDPEVLAKLDAVFVTVEPGSGGQKPTGKQLLFASLRIPPNHP
jgi:hypothetical protein